MKAISTGNTYRLYDDTMKTYDFLPAQTYIIRFNQMSGFYLEKYNELEVKEEKIYGVHEAKVRKVLNTFSAFNRNLGIILSGDKGIGKSMFARLLGIEAVKIGLPLIIVEHYIPGIASFIEEIEQEAMFLFDEFDKTFNSSKDDDPQSEMLSLFDGITPGKKMFVITCNRLNNLNDYLVNRTGRFHYHFRFDYPTGKEIRAYLEDKLDKAYWDEIDGVISFSRKVKLNYDSLRAIVFELNTGESFKDAITDLNILNVRDNVYKAILRFPDGTSFTSDRLSIDLFDKEKNKIWVEGDRNDLVVVFTPTDAIFDVNSGALIVPENAFKIDYRNDDELEEEYKDEVPSLSLVPIEEKPIHYVF